MTVFAELIPSRNAIPSVSSAIWKLGGWRTTSRLATAQVPDCASSDHDVFSTMSVDRIAHTAVRGWLT